MISVLTVMIYSILFLHCSFRMNSNFLSLLSTMPVRRTSFLIVSNKHTVSIQQEGIISGNLIYALLFTGKPPAVALFAIYGGYKRESYRASEYAPRILAEQNLTVLLKVGHMLLLLEEARVLTSV